MTMEQVSYLAAVTGLCIGAVNIIVEVLKGSFFKDSRHIPAVVVAVSEFVALCVMYASCVMEGESVGVLEVLGAVAGGFFIAYGAMFGYEKLYGEMLERLKETLKQ